MYKKTFHYIPLLLLALLLFSSSVCFAQGQTTLSLNDEKVNLRSGISFKEFQDLNKVSLKLENVDHEQLNAFAEVRIFLARGSRPLQMQKYMQPEGELIVTELLRNAQAGDRLVIEFFGDNTSDTETSGQIVTLALN